MQGWCGLLGSRSVCWVQGLCGPKVEAAALWTSQPRSLLLLAALTWRCIAGRRRTTFGVDAPRDAAPRLLGALHAALARRGVPCVPDAARFTLTGTLGACGGAGGAGGSRSAPLPGSSGGRLGGDSGSPASGPLAGQPQAATGGAGGCSLRVAMLQEAPGVFAVTASVPASCPDAAARRFAALIGEVRTELATADGWHVKS